MLNFQALSKNPFFIEDPLHLPSAEIPQNEYIFFLIFENAIIACLLFCLLRKNRNSLEKITIILLHLLFWLFLILAVSFIFTWGRLRLVYAKTCVWFLSKILHEIEA